MSSIQQKTHIRKTAVHLASSALMLALVAVVALPLYAHADSSALSGYLHLKNPIGGTTDVNGVLANILDGIVLILTPVLVIMLLYAGFLFVSAQGNTEKLGDAKKALVWTIVGAAIVLGAKELANVIGSTVSQLAS